MGIINLNQIAKEAKVYNIKANTAIIDGSNLIYIYLCTASRCLKDPLSYRNYNVNIIDVEIEQQIYTIVEQALLSLIRYTYFLYGKLTNERNIIFVFDPYKEPKYIINHKIFTEETIENIEEINNIKIEEEYEMKKDERKKRAEHKAVDVDSLISKELDKLVKINNSDVNNEVLTINEITQLLNISD